MTTRRPHSVILLLITLIFCTLFVALGFWQIQRAQQEQRHEAILAQRAGMPPMDMQQLASLKQPDNFPVQASGHFDNAHSLLLDNRFFNEQVGYEVLTPFTTNQGQSLLVNRGWLPRGASRAVLPTIPSIEGQVTLHGISHQPGHNPFLPATLLSAHPTWPQRVAEIDLAQISNQLGQSLLPVIVRLDPDVQFAGISSLPRNWQQPVQFTPARHLAYAIQWFLFALIALGIYLFRILRKSPQEPGNPS